MNKTRHRKANAHTSTTVITQIKQTETHNKDKHKHRLVSKMKIEKEKYCWVGINILTLITRMHPMPLLPIPQTASQRPAYIPTCIHFRPRAQPSLLFVHNANDVLEKKMSSNRAQVESMRPGHSSSKYYDNGWVSNTISLAKAGMYVRTIVQFSCVSVTIISAVL